MRRRKIMIQTVLIVLILLLVVAVFYAWPRFPLISGYGAKNMASAYYLQHRSKADILKEDLNGFPFSLASFTINEKDSSVTGSVWGLAKRKAIYLDGVGCILVNDFTEDEIRNRQRYPSLKTIVNPDTAVWPYGDIVVDSLPAAINKDLLQKAIRNVMNDSSKGKPAHTRAVLIIYDGDIVAEEYAPGFNKNTVMLGWSVSKSLIAAMIGVLVRQGKLNINAPAPVPAWKNTEKENITIKQLLQQTTGLDFKEDYTRPSEVTKMLFNHGDMAAFTAGLPLKYKPGTVFNYSSGNTNILSWIIRQTVGEKDYANFVYQFFHTINMYSTLLEPDASGTYIGSSYSYATARDFARFGLLYYNNGVWNNEQILPAEWVKESIVAAAADERKHYGYQFWLNGYDESHPAKRWYPDVPADMFFADGYGGQDIYIIPSKKLVVVRLGLHVINENKFLKEVISSVN
ncbi:MAG: serine hydrolase domain-containing protein [Chitinophagaceae bacterium]